MKRLLLTHLAFCLSQNGDNEFEPVKKSYESTIDFSVLPKNEDGDQYKINWGKSPEVTVDLIILGRLIGAKSSKNDGRYCIYIVYDRARKRTLAMNGSSMLDEQLSKVNDGTLVRVKKSNRMSKAKKNYFMFEVLVSSLDKKNYTLPENRELIESAFPFSENHKFYSHTDEWEYNRYKYVLSDRAFNDIKNGITFTIKANKSDEPSADSKFNRDGSQGAQDMPTQIDDDLPF